MVLKKILVGLRRFEGWRRRVWLKKKKGWIGLDWIGLVEEENRIKGFTEVWLSILFYSILFSSILFSYHHLEDYSRLKVWRFEGWRLIPPFLSFPFLTLPYLTLIRFKVYSYSRFTQGWRFKVEGWLSLLFSSILFSSLQVFV